MPGSVLSILGVIPQRIGGAEMLARELSLQLTSAGWRSVVCFPEEPKDNVRRFFDVPGVEIEVARCSNPGWRDLGQLVRLFRRYRPEVLHVSFGSLSSLYPWLARSCSIRRIFLTDQGSRPEGYIPRRSVWWKRAVRQVLNWPTSGIIAVSDFNARVDDALGLVRDGRLRRIYNGVDLTRPLGDRQSFRRQYSIPDDRRIVLQVSWMIPEKGIADLLAAAKLVLARHDKVHFVIAGEGPCRKEFMELAAREGLAGCITWTGRIEDPLAAGVYRAADVVCQLSRWQEAFGWTIAEAMACERPVIGTRVGGIPELVGDGVSGFLVPPRQPAAAAERILQLLDDDALRRGMGEAGRAKVERLFNLRRNVSDLIGFYGIDLHHRG